jgi:hypothetical protein
MYIKRIAEEDLNHILGGSKIRIVLGARQVGKPTHELADGTELKLDIASADVEFMGEIVGTTIVLGRTMPSVFLESPPWNP